MLKSLPLNVISGYLEPPNFLFKIVGKSMLLDRVTCCFVNLN